MKSSFCLTSQEVRHIELEWKLFCICFVLSLVILIIYSIVRFCLSPIKPHDTSDEQYAYLSIGVLLFDLNLSVTYILFPSSTPLLSFGLEDAGRLVSGICLFLLLFSAYFVASLAYFFVMGMVAGVIEIINGDSKPVYSQPSKKASTTSIQQVDKMSGRQFEAFCRDLLVDNGYYNVELTPASGDQGVDITAQKNSNRYAIQCKHYSSNVGNRAVQEVCAGKAFYKCNTGIVITNSHFTKKAKELAKANHVVLLDRNDIIRLMDTRPQNKFQYHMSTDKLTVPYRKRNWS